MKERSLCNFSGLILLSGILFLAPGIVSANSELSTVVGVYEGEIESNIMVQASTEFYLDASSRLMGRYRYQDQGGWDQGDIFNVRISKQCGTNLDPVGGSSTSNSSGSNSGSLTGLFGAAGKKKKKNSSQGQSGSSLRLGELCITGLWRDSYGQGPLKLIFSPTRDSFSGYYRGSPDDEWAIWRGANIPKSRLLTSGANTTNIAQSGAQADPQVVSTEAKSNYEEFSEKGVGRTKERAIKEAFFFAVEQKVTSLVGGQAAGDVGHWFKVQAKDFDQFKSRYFTPESMEGSCTSDASGKHVCTVTGRLKLVAIESDVREFTKKSERKLVKNLIFFLKQLSCCTPQSIS